MTWHGIVSLRHFLGWLVSAFRSREDLVLENLALRRQLLALHAQQPRRRLTALHKLFWVALRTCWSGWTKPLILVTPRTVVNWHHAGFRLYWAWVSKVRKVGGRKRVSKEVRALIFRMVAENPTWGAPRIHAARAGFRALGKECLAMDPASSERSRFREAMADVPQKPSRGNCGKGFLHRPNAHVWCSVLLFRLRPRPADPASQCDAKSQCTLGCTAIARSLGLATTAQILAIRSRRKVWRRGDFGCEGHGKQTNSHGLGCPWQNGVAERWVGSCRHDLLDHVIILNERHLKRLMSSYLLYCHEDRTHLGLAKDTPGGRAAEIRSNTESKIQSFPRLGGLHHRYAAAA